MTRVSDYSAQQSLLLSYLNTQNNLLTAQKQVSSGKVADTFEGYGRDSARLLSAQSLVNRADVFSQSAQNASNRLAAQDIQLSSVEDAGASLRQSATQAIATGQGAGIESALNQIVSRVSAALNTEVAGEHLFAGTRTDTAPVTVRTLDELLAAPSVASVFQNNNRVPKAQVEDGVSVNTGFLASDIASDLFQQIRDLAAQGPFDGPLTSVQQNYLTSKLPEFESIADKLTQATASNGDLQRTVDQSIERNARVKDYATRVAGDISDVDVAEAISRLTQDQTALQASARVLASIGQASLLKFL